MTISLVELEEITRLLTVIAEEIIYPDDMSSGREDPNYEDADWDSDTVMVDTMVKRSDVRAARKLIAALMGQANQGPIQAEKAQ